MRASKARFDATAVARFDFDGLLLFEGLCLRGEFTGVFSKSEESDAMKRFFRGEVIVF